MQTAEFSHKLDALQEKRTALHARVTACRQPGPPAVPAGVLAELAAALEELTVAEEEVRQQQDELLAAHLALAEDRHRYAELFNGAPDGYLVTDTMGRISEANLAAAALFQRPQQFLIGRLLAVLVARSERRRLYALLGELAAGKAVGEQEVRFALRAGTTFEVALTVSLMRTTCGQVVGMRWLLRDSTKRNQVHQLLQATTEELERRVQERTAALEHEITEHKHDKEALRLVAEQLHRSHAELQQIAYVSSHDLQEPLRMVTSYVQLLARRYQKQLDAEAQEFIGFAVEGAQRMKALIDGLLAYLGVETQEQEFGPVACEAVLATVLSTLQPAISESQAVLTHDRLPTVRGNQRQIGYVLHQLLSNALTFHGTAPARVHVWATPGEQEWVFAVRDAGLGIAPEQRERIFGMFQRLHLRQVYPGTGIGLAICKKIVEHHAGRIWVESTPGQGATFFFTLPAA